MYHNRCNFRLNDVSGKCIIFTTTLLLLSSLLLLAGCSKPSSEKAPALESSTLLSYLPESTLGYFSFNGNSPQARAYAQSPWGKHSQGMISEGVGALFANMTDTAAGNKEETVSRLQLILDAFGVTGNAPAVESSLAFVSAEPFGGCLYATAVKGGDVSGVITSIVNELKKRSPRLEVAPLHAEAAQGERLTLKDDEKGGPPVNVFTLATPDKGAVCVQDESLAQRFFAPADDSGWKKLQARPSFVKAQQALGDSGPVLSSLFVDFPLAFSTLEKQATTGHPLAKGALAEANVSLEDLFVDSLAAYTKFDDPMYTHRFVIPLVKNEQTQEVTRLIAEGLRGNSRGVETLPAGMVVAFALNSGFLDRLTPEALELSEEDGAQLRQMQTQLQGLKSLVVGVGSLAPGMLIPSVHIQAESSQVQEQLKTLKESVASLAGSALGAGQQPGALALNWSEKTIQGKPVSYLILPLGIGLYAAETDGSVLAISTSEGGIQSVLNAQSNSKDTLGSSLPTALQKTRPSQDRIFTGYMNYDLMSDLVTSAEGTLAMFSGGASRTGEEDPFAQLKNLKGLGQAIVDISLQDNTIVVDASLSKGPEQKG